MCWMNKVGRKTTTNLGLPLVSYLAVWNELAHVNSYEFGSVVAWLVQAQLQAPVINTYR